LRSSPPGRADQWTGWDAGSSKTNPVFRGRCVTRTFIHAPRLILLRVTDVPLMRKVMKVGKHSLAVTLPSQLVEFEYLGRAALRVSKAEPKNPA